MTIGFAFASRAGAKSVLVASAFLFTASMAHAAVEIDQQSLVTSTPASPAPVTARA